MVARTLFIYFGFSMSILPLVAMEEENRGTKRPFEQTQPRNQTSQSVKKAKNDGSEGPEHVIFKMYDNKEIKILRSNVNLSSTLSNLVNDAFENEEDKTTPIPLPRNEHFTKKRIKIIKKILKLISKGQVGQEDEQIVNFLQEESDEQQIINRIIIYFDLEEKVQDILNQKNVPSEEKIAASSFVFKADDSTPITVPAQVVRFYEYFNTLLNAGLKESDTYEIETNLSVQDLTLLIELLKYEYQLERNMDDSLRVKSIAQKIHSIYNDKEHNFLAIINQAHQWRLSLMVKAFLSYYFENSNNLEIFTFIKDLPVDYYPYCFAPEVINVKNAGILFRSCLQLFTVKTYAELKIYQKQKIENIPYSGLNALIVFLPCFRAFEAFFSLNNHLIPSISRFAKQQIDYMLKEYENFEFLKESNREVFEVLEVILRNFLIEKMKDVPLEKEMPRVTAFIDKNWYLQERVISEVYSPLLKSFSIVNFANQLTFNIANNYNYELKSFFIYENLFIYQTNSGKMFEYSLLEKRIVREFNVENMKLFGVTKDNFIFQNETTFDLILKNRVDQKQVVIQLEKQEFINKLLILNDETFVIKQKHSIRLIRYYSADDTFKEDIVVDQEFFDKQVSLIYNYNLKFEFIEKINDKSFLIAYPNETILLAKSDGTYEIIQDKLKNEPDKYVPVHIEIINIFSPVADKYFIVLYKVGAVNSYYYEIWDSSLLKKIYVSKITQSLLKGFYDTNLIFSKSVPRQYLGVKSFEQFCPYIATFEQLLNYYKKFIIKN